MSAVSIHPTREAWLDAAVVALKPMFAEIARTVPEVVRISTGWSRGAKKNSVGWCWRSDVADDKSSNIFISPTLADPITILAVILHELCHAVDDCKSAHGGDFRKMWGQHGFVGKPTASTPGDPLRARLTELLDQLGAYPHAALNPGMQVKTQGTRMLKLVAGCCGYTVRTSQKWIDEGLPSCPCGSDMELAS